MTVPDPDLARRVACSAYVVDTVAVAEAIVARLTQVLEADEVRWPAERVEEDGPRAVARDA